MTRYRRCDPTFVNVWESAVADLNAVGIRADYVAQAFPEWLKHWLAGDWPYDLFGIGHDLTGELDASQSFTSFSSCLKNPPYYCNEEEMPLVNAMITEMDSKKREQILHELLRINAENAPIIFLTEGIEAVTYNPKIKNLKVVNLIINYHELEIAN